MMPSFDQKPPMSGKPMMEREPTSMAVAVRGIFEAKPPMFSMDWASNSS